MAPAAILETPFHDSHSNGNPRGSSGILTQCSKNKSKRQNKSGEEPESTDRKLMALSNPPIELITLTRRRRDDPENGGAKIPGRPATRGEIKAIHLIPRLSCCLPVNRRRRPGPIIHSWLPFGNGAPETGRHSISAPSVGNLPLYMNRKLKEERR